MLSLKRVVQTPICLLLLSFLIAPPARGQQAASDTSEVEAPELRRELLAMSKADQEMRAELVELIQTSEGQPDMQAFMRMKTRLDSLDTVRADRVGEIMKEHGWPDPALVGRDGTEAAFLIVQHADLAFQKRPCRSSEKRTRKGNSAASRSRF